VAGSDGGQCLSAKSRRRRERAGYNHSTLGIERDNAWSNGARGAECLGRESGSIRAVQLGHPGDLVMGTCRGRCEGAEPEVESPGIGAGEVGITAIIEGC